MAQSGDTLYILKARETVIKAISLSTKQVRTLVAENSARTGHRNGNGNQAIFANPIGIAAKGIKLYIADTSNHRIREVTIGATPAATTVRDFAGGGGTTGAAAMAASGTANGARLTAARFNNPEGIAISGDMLYVADTGNHRIRAVNLTSGIVSTIAGSTSGHQDGTSARFNVPTGIAVSGNTLYVVDKGNHRIRAIDLASKTVSTLAGSMAGTADGIGAAAQFSKPYDVAVSGNTLYVVDAASHRIRAVNLTSGEVSTIAGSTQGYKDGIGTAAQFSFEYFGGVVADSDIRLFVTDYLNHRIRLFEYK